MEAVYNKLVRDNIPQIILADGKTPITSKVEGNERLKELLIAKLYEELEEYKEQYAIEELADLLEIIHALVEVVEGESFERLEKLRLEKREARGGFEKGIILEKVIE